MLSAHSQLNACLTRFCLSNPVLIDDTAIARVWRCHRAPESVVVLKIYKDANLHDEAPGFDMLKYWRGEGAAMLIDRQLDAEVKAVVVEWLAGSSLGDLSRRGQDDLSNQRLVRVAVRLHTASGPAPDSLVPLADTFTGLLRFAIPKHWRRQAQNDFRSCQRMAEKLLNSQIMVSPLHGDLHHDNIRYGDRGYCAFDAKGLLGERTFELANAFRNPAGAQSCVFNRHRVETMATLFASTFAVDRSRLLKWAAVKCAQSIGWQANESKPEDLEFELLSILVLASGGQQ